jgi:hypothetical protein
VPNYAPTHPVISSPLQAYTLQLLVRRILDLTN